MSAAPGAMDPAAPAGAAAVPLPGPVPGAGLADFPPAYFALVMATGIVSVAAHLVGLTGVARALLVLNVGAYAVLWTLNLLRLARHPARVRADFGTAARGIGFLTVVAATNVLGSQFLLLTPWRAVAVGLWWAGLLLWGALLYTLLAALTFSERKQSLEVGIGGTTLLVVVATESVSVLGALLGGAPPAQPTILLVALLTHLTGAMLYFPFITLILYRWLFFPLPADALTPPYWINMGALAITTLAGARLLLVAPGWPMLDELRVLLRGATLFFWAAALWWIPLLVMVGVWRYGIRRVRLRHDPQYWSLVFPLGMFTVATLTLVKATGWRELTPVAQVMAPLALGAWAVAALALAARGLAALGRRVARPSGR